MFDSNRYHGCMTPRQSLSIIFAANVRTLFAARGWSQNEFAKNLGITGPAASRLLSGTHVPSGITIEKTAKLFDVAPHELLTPSKKKK